MVKSSDDDIILNCQIKAHDCWVAGVTFLRAMPDKGAQSATAPCKKNINDLHIELGLQSESITHATAKALGIKVTGTFKLCEDLPWEMLNNAE